MDYLGAVSCRLLNPPFSRFLCWWLRWVMTVSGSPEREASADHHTHSSSVFQLMTDFLKDLQNEYFPHCTLIILHESDTNRNVCNNNTELQRDSLCQDERPNLLTYVLAATEDTSRLLFTLDQELSENLMLADLNTATHCPVYLTLALNVSAVQYIFLLPNMDWDKYFNSRKHVVFTESSTSSVEVIFRQGEVNAMTNLLVVRAGTTSTLQVLTNTPYSLPSLRRLLSWRRPLMGRNKIDLFPDKLVDLHDYRMQVVTFHFPPRIFMEQQESGNYILYGVDIEVRALIFASSSFDHIVSLSSSWSDYKVVGYVYSSVQIPRVLRSETREQTFLQKF